VTYEQFTNADKKGIVMVSDWFNSFLGEIDAKYFPNVKYYRDDENDTKVHYAAELFNNGVITYATFVKRLAKACNDTHENIHSILFKYISSY